MAEETSFLEDQAETASAASAIDTILGRDSDSTNDTSTDDQEGQGSGQKGASQTTNAVDEGMDEEGNILGEDGKDTKPESDDAVEQKVNEVDDDENRIEVDERQYDAGIAAGFTEEQIGEMAENNPKYLETLAANYKGKEPDAKTPDAEKPSDQKPDKVEADEGFKLSADVFSPEQLEALQPLVDSNNDLSKEVKDLREDTGDMHQASIDQEVSRFFNRLHEDYPEFGKLDRDDGVNILTPSEQKARTAVCNHANLLQAGSEVLANNGQGQALSVNQSMNLAMNAHKGSTAEKRATGKIITKLNKSKRMFVPRTKGRKVETEFKNEDDRAVHNIETDERLKDIKFRSA